jgi:hypothetical protein
MPVPRSDGRIILRQRASGQVGHVNDETLDDGPYDDQEEQADRYLNGAESLGAKSQAAGTHSFNDRRHLS